MKMNYLLHKSKRRKTPLFSIVVVLLVVIIVIWQALFLVGLSRFIVSPVWVFRSVVVERFAYIGEFFNTKDVLIAEKEALEDQVEKQRLELLTLDVLRAENAALKGVNTSVRQANPRQLPILVHPPRSPYDTLIADSRGQEVLGDEFFVAHNIILGRVGKVYRSSTDLVLFSSPEERLDAQLVRTGIPVELVGLGGGTFSLQVIEALDIVEGDILRIPGFDEYVVAVVEVVEVDASGQFKNVRARVPLNIYELSFVNIIGASEDVFQDREDEE
jgi:cell shape-determining protein MreC